MQVIPRIIPARSRYVSSKPTGRHFHGTKTWSPTSYGLSLLEFFATVSHKLDLTSHLTSHTMAFQESFMAKWQLQEAKARFSELIDDTLEKGPQVVTRRGIDTAVVVSIDEWHKLKDENRLTGKDVLVGEGPRFGIPLPKRGTVKSRKPPVFD